MLHIVTGLPGSGKTEVAKYLAKKLKAVIINTDEVRDMLFPQEGRNEIGDFTSEQLKQVYSVLRPIAYYLSKANPKKHFIMEGTFRLNSQRQNVIDEMQQLKHPFSVILVEVDEEEAKRRVQERFNASKSESTVVAYLETKKVYERPENAIVINNSGTLRELKQKLNRYIGSLGGTF